MRNVNTVTLGAGNNSELVREETDFYATPPFAVQQLLDMEQFSQYIWEPACGAGHISKVLEENGKRVTSSDLYDHGYGSTGIDFLKEKNYTSFDIITNPPYHIAQEFLETALNIVREGGKVAMLLRLSFLEGRKRRELFDKYPPKTVYVSSGRFGCAKGGDFTACKDSKSAVAHAWFVWEKGYTGDTVIKWFN